MTYAFLLLAAGFVLFIIFLWQSGGLSVLRSLVTGRGGNQGGFFAASSAYLYSSPLLFLPAALILIEAGSRGRNRTLIVFGALAVLPIVLESAANGTRSALLPILASLFLIPYLRRDRRPRARAVALLGFFVFTVGITFVGSARDVGLRREKGSKSLLFASISRPDRGLRSFLESGDTEMAPLMAIAVSEVPHRMPYMHGRATAEVVVHWIPRLVWPDKPRQGDEVLTRKLFYDTGLSTAPRQYSPLANFYLDFGFAGVGVGMFLLGMLARFHYAYFRANYKNRTVQLAYAATLPFWVVLLRGNITDTLGRLFFVLPPLLLGVYLARERGQTIPRTPEARLWEQRAHESHDLRIAIPERPA